MSVVMIYKKGKRDKAIRREVADLEPFAPLYARLKLTGHCVLVDVSKPKDTV